MAAILRVTTITTTVAFLLTCIASCPKPVISWVLVPPHQQQRLESVTTGLGRQNAVCCLGAHETGSVATERATTKANPTATIESWDNQVIRWVDGILEQKAEQCPFVSELDFNKEKASAVPYEWVVAPDCSNGNKNEAPRNIALRTTGEPLLDAKSIALIREAAQNLWDRQKSSSSSSRFTLQFEDTNSECHLDELVASDAQLKKVVDELLTQKVYPLVRSAFGNQDRYDLTDGSLCVYDSLVVRYNGDKAMDRFGASQPLHGDGGVVSVNIALNSHREQEDKSIQDTFSGGGTFFEDMIQLEDGKDYDPILRPSSTGHALAHWSIHRHAGAPTLSGTRDILVIFVTQKRAQHTNNLFNGIERSFQLKLKARELPHEQREMALRCLDLAIDKCPFDAQAHFWKGFHLIQQQGGPPRADAPDTSAQEQRLEELSRSIFHLERAKECAPFDAKVSCYAGMAYRQRWMFAQPQQAPQEKRAEDLERATSCLERALLLHKHYCQHGISSDFGDNANTARITLSEVYLQQERYERALEFLLSIETEPSLTEAMRQHICKLIAHCREQLNQSETHEHKPEHSMT